MRMILESELRIQFELAGEGFEIASEGIAISPYHLLAGSLTGAGRKLSPPVTPTRNSRYENPIGERLAPKIVEYKGETVETGIFRSRWLAV